MRDYLENKVFMGDSVSTVHPLLAVISRVLGILKKQLKSALTQYLFFPTLCNIIVSVLCLYSFCLAYYWGALKTVEVLFVQNTFLRLGAF